MILSAAAKFSRQINGSVPIRVISCRLILRASNVQFRPWPLFLYVWWRWPKLWRYRRSEVKNLFRL